MIVYIAFVIIALLIGLCVKGKRFRLYMFILAMVLAILAYHMDVHPNSDLTNHYNRINLYRDNQISILNMLGSLNVGSQLYLWFFSFLPNNAYFQAVSVFICYNLMFSLAYNVCKDNDAPKSVYLLCIAAILMAYNFYMMANSIRFWLASSVFLYLLHSEIIRKKSKPLIWIGYLALAFFHYGVLPLVAARLVALVLTNIRKHNLSSWFMIAICGIGVIIFLNSAYFNAHVLAKVEGYSTYATRGTWQTIIGFLRIITVCILIWHAFKQVDSKYKEYLMVVLFICAIPFFLFTNYTLILRLGDTAIAASSVAIVLSNKASRQPGIAINRMTLFNILLIICMIGCFVAFMMFDYRNLVFNF